MNKIPTLLDLVCEYVQERIPKHEFIRDDNKWLEVYLFRNSASQRRLLAMINKDHMVIIGNNDKMLIIDAYTEDSIDVMYRLIRFNLSKILRERRQFIKEHPYMREYLYGERKS